MPTEHWVQGETGPRRWILKAGATPIDLTSIQVGIEAHRQRSGAPVSLQGEVTIIDAEHGVIQFTPHQEDLRAEDSPLMVRVKLIDVDGKAAYLPEGEPDVWIVRAI